MPPTSRRVAFAGKTLSPGRHAVVVSGPRGELAATVIVGAEPGPRVVLVGGIESGDSLGLAVARRLSDALDGQELAGSLVLLPHLVGVRNAMLAGLTAGAAFVVEVRAGPPGWATAAHLRVDLASSRAARLARAFGGELIIDAPAGFAQLRFEAGERGRVDDGNAAQGATGLLRLLGARGVLLGEAPDAPVRRRVVVDDVVRVRLRRGGTVVPVAAPGTLVIKGGALLAVYDEAGRERSIVSASQRSVIIATASAASAAPGGVVARVGRVRVATRAPSSHAMVVGWCEWIALPELGITRLHAKIDTGARTSALHVRDLRVDGDRVEMLLPRRRATHVRLPLVEHVIVRDSGGHEERRPVIETLLVIGPLRRHIRLTLTNRGDMQFPMLVGRSALGPDVLVDASRQDLLGP